MEPSPVQQIVNLPFLSYKQTTIEIYNSESKQKLKRISWK